MKRIIKNVIVTLLIITLSASTALLAYLHYFASDDKELSGEWTTDLDMTERAAVTALSWLQDIEAVSVSLEDMESYMQGLSVQVNLAMDQNAQRNARWDAHRAGTFSCNVSPESYDVCKEAAYEAFAMAFQELLTKRLRMAGCTGGTDREEIEALVAETFGMSTVSYLMSSCPDLLPSLEELQAQYDGSGTYEVTEDILTRRFEDGEAVIIKEEYYIRKGSILILPEENVVFYSREQRGI